MSFKNNNLKIILLALFAIIATSSIIQIRSNTTKIALKTNNLVDKSILYLIYHPKCPHCHKAINFLEASQLDSVKIKKVNITTEQGKKLSSKIISDLNIPLYQVRVPLFVINNQYQIGFTGQAASSNKLLEWIKSESDKYRTQSNN